jgi:hypothetical protein
VEPQHRNGLDFELQAGVRNRTNPVSLSIAAAFSGLKEGHAIVSSDTTSPSGENQTSGLWLWHGKAPLPLPPSPPQPASRAQQSLDLIVSGLRKGGWMALPGGVALALFAVVLRSTPPDQPAPTDTPVAVEPIRSPAEAHAVIPAPPVNIPTPWVEHTDTPFDQAQMPSAPATPGTEHQLAKKAAHHTSARTVGKTHAFASRGSPFFIRGVLTPPEPTVSRDGGH